MTKPVSTFGFQPFVVVDALRKLMANKEDTTQVFRLLIALRGRSFDKNFARFAASPVGARVLANKEDLIVKLSDRAYLKGLPKGTLGLEFIDFLDFCGITSDGLNEAAREGGATEERLSEDQIRFARRTRVQHDLWHVIGGYGCDGFGEVCNLGFSYPHSRNIGMMVMAIAGANRYAKAFPGEPIWAAMWEGLRRGRKAIWLPGVDWEALLELPLTDVRKQLGVHDMPAKYQAAPKVIRASGPLAAVPV
jgi:ubiquinone biosynthesis protein COQ4